MFLLLIISLHAQNFNEVLNTVTFNQVLTKDIELDLSSGSVTVRNSPDDQVTVDCRGMTKSLEITDGEKLSIKSDVAADCRLEIPTNRSITIKGKQLNTSFDRIRNNVAVQVDQGDVKFFPRRKGKYKYELDINGIKEFEDFISSPVENTYDISINTKSGSITKEMP